MTYIVVYEDRLGRVLHGLTDQPWHLLFALVHTGVLGDKVTEAKKRAKRAKMYVVQEVER